ncbi:hypothetical protein ACFWHW_05250 [Streptomyces pharetrae]|uniref:hypothetical protein n=1 Tax=Streptomyces pharetrae TaxID=291370 RepID=UPI003661CA91
MRRRRPAGALPGPPTRPPGGCPAGRLGRRPPGWGWSPPVADRHTAFRRLPYPDETLSADSRVQRISDLRTRLDTAARAYLTALGHLDGPAVEELDATVDGLGRLVRAGYAASTVPLLPWLRFAHLLACAARTSTVIER